MFRIINRLLICILIIGLAACANRGGGPQGGPKDSIPPQVKSSEPSFGATNFKKQRIEVEFDEYISLTNPGEKVIISPPQKEQAEIKSFGKKAVVILGDSLKENTTYTIDFTDALGDLNENNKLDNFSMSFSTGETLDTLQISGTVLDAGTLNPVSGSLVGIYDNLSDTAFTKTAPLRITKTNNKGQFSIKNIKAGTYNVFALNDKNRDYIYNDPNEDLAFLSTTITPTIEKTIQTDTIGYIDSIATEKVRVEHKDSVVRKDSIITKEVEKFIPNALVLFSFKKNVYKQHFSKAERKQADIVSFFFKEKNEQKPIITPLNFELTNKDLIQCNTTNDSIHYWLVDSTLINQDSLTFTVSYQVLDSTNTLITQTDTTTAFFKHHEVKEKKKKKDEDEKSEEPEVSFLTVKTNIDKPLDIYKPISLSFEVPVDSIIADSVHLYNKIDTVWVEIPCKLTKKDSIGLNYEISQKWDSSLPYRLEIDSAGIFDIHKQQNNNIKKQFRVKSENEYSNLIVTIPNVTDNAIIEVLDEKDNVLKQLPAKTSGTIFDYMNPGEYYLRMFIDKNGNRLWDTGDYENKTQPEEMYYYHKSIEVRANWDIEQEWDYKHLPFEKQKPEILFPKEDSKKKK